MRFKEWKRLVYDERGSGMIEQQKEPTVDKSEKFPLCKSLGLDVYVHSINASDLERVLASGVGVEGFRDKGYGWQVSQKGMDPDPRDTHSALLINIQPIKAPDTAEQIVRDLVELTSGGGIIEYRGDHKTAHSLSKLIERAKLVGAGGNG